MRLFRGAPTRSALARRLRRGEARFRELIERNADAIVVVDRGGIVRFANPAAARLFGRDRVALVGSAFGAPIVVGETSELDIAHDGTSVVAEMRVVPSEWEGERAFIASLRDITERKRGEETARRLAEERAARHAAERSERRLRVLAELTAAFSGSLDYRTTLATIARVCVQEFADWTVLYGRDEDGEPRRLEVAHRDPAKAPLAAALRAMPLGGAAANPVREVIRTGHPHVDNDFDDEALARIGLAPAEVDLVRRLGIRAVLLVPLVARGRTIGAVAFVSNDPARRFGDEDLALARDVAWRAALALDNATLYSEATRANQAKADFLAVVSHDLRTPLNAVMGYADLLCMGVPEPLSPAVRDRIDRIRTSARHLSYLLNELLSFARLEAGREVLRPADTDACELAREVVAMMEPLAAERGLTLVCATGDGVPRVTTDPDKARQILVNLVGNAVKYTERGRVTVSVRPDEENGSAAEIEVRDTGPGIAREHLEHIFEPFWQADPSQRSRGGGTGLGLSVVRRMANLLGARVRVESEEGAGSAFTVVLPPRVPERASDRAATV